MTPDPLPAPVAESIFATYVAARQVADQWPLRLHLGASDGRLAGWLTVAASGEPDLVLDPRFGLPFADGSVDLICAARQLDSMPPGIALLVIAEAHRVLRPGGVLRLASAGLATSGADGRRTVDLLAAAGFGELVRRAPGQSDHPALRDLPSEAGCTNVIEGIR